MFDYDPRGELAWRRYRVAGHRQPNGKDAAPQRFILTSSHLNADFVRSRFPGILQTCAKFGLDITKDKIPVRPGAHYMIGGVTVDTEGHTSVPGLWAAGEVSSSGLHGANRLASNSLLEGLVYGSHAGAGASEAAAKINDTFHALPLENPAIKQATEPLDLSDIRNSLKSLMWRSAGVRRDRTSLEEAAVDIDTWCRYVLPLSSSITPKGGNCKTC